MGSDAGLDGILRELGAFGRYTIVNCALILFPIFLAGCHSSVFVFEAPDINYRCYISECEHLNNTLWLDHAIPKENGIFMKCKRYGSNSNSTNTCGLNFNTSIILDCNEYVYSDEDSAVKDFNLGCQDWKRTLIGTIRNSGIFFSYTLTGMLSDKYGRKLVLSVAAFMKGLFGLLRSFSHNYPMMICLEFFEGATGVGVWCTAYVLAIELVGPKGRVFGSTLLHTMYAFGLMTFSGLAWWLQSWRTLLRVIYTPALSVISYYWILNESIRWLMNQGRHQEATMILKKAAKMNKVQLSDEVFTPLYELEKLPAVNTQENRTVPNELKQNKEPSIFIKVFKSSIIRKRVFVCSFLWTTCSFVYFGLSVNSVLLAGNMYVNYMLVGFVEIPANFFCLLFLDRFGRKKFLIATFMLSSCLCISLSFLPKGQKWWALILFLSGKFFITVAYSTMYIYVSELIPTGVRQFLISICASLGRLGSVMSPLTPLLALYYENLPAIIFGSMALVASLLVFTLPETINQVLPDTIEEAEALSHKVPSVS